ncbi:hypothetical protein ANN_13753 [Periplaneta americana]|uniref:PHD-type domain-containing protein n=1 Tax=Periplaneta americana TaxID=6978 RepID=A0ABQ8SUE5_PERAM|nr:hypothetical protein ANN_13753 [Periplaneta americana]
MPTNASQDKCPKCAKDIHNNDQPIGCEGNCKEWFHKICIGLTETEAKALRGKKGNLLWMCPKCRALLEAFGVNTQPPEITEIRRTTAENRETCNQIKLKLEDLETTLLRKMSLLLEAQLQQADHLLKGQTNDEERRSRSTTDKPPIPNQETQNTENNEVEQHSRPPTIIKAGTSAPRPNQRHMGQKINTPQDETYRRNSPIPGIRKANEGPIRAAKRKTAWIFIGRIDPTIDSQQLTKYILDLGITAVTECTELETRGTSKAFKVGVPLEERHTIFDPSAWEEGILVKPFRFR